MKKHLIIIILLGCVISAHAQKRKTIANMKAVNLNDGWVLPKEGAALAAGVTYTPDKTLWFADFFEWKIRQYDKKGKEIKSFYYQKTLGDIPVEGITYQKIGSRYTLWLLNSTKGSPSLIHVDTSENKLEDSFSITLDKPNYLLGVTYDSSNDTFWVISSAPEDKLYNVNKSGKVIAEFDIANSGVKDGRGIDINPKDNTLWIVNNINLPGKRYADAEMYHFDKQGNKLQGGFSIKTIAPNIQFPEDVAFSPKDNSFWIIGCGDGYLYHIGLRK